MMRNPYFQKNVKLKLDYIFGLRFLAIIAYGIMPTSLVYLGVIKLDDIVIPATYNLYRSLLLAFVVLIPLGVMYMLIKQRMQKSYLFDNFSRFRSLLLTLEIYLGILIVSVSISILTGTYPKSGMPASVYRDFLIKSFLSGTATLSVSSTLFSTILTKEMEIPGMPLPETDNEIYNIKFLLKTLFGTNGLQWNEEPNMEKIGESLCILEKVENHLKALKNNKNVGYGTEKLLVALIMDIKDIKTTLKDVSLEANWKKYLSDAIVSRDQIDKTIADSNRNFLLANWDIT